MRSEFGWVEISGARYEHDVIIHTDGSVSKRNSKISIANLLLLKV